MVPNEQKEKGSEQDAQVFLNNQLYFEQKYQDRIGVGWL